MVPVALQVISNFGTLSPGISEQPDELPFYYMKASASQNPNGLQLCFAAFTHLVTMAMMFPGYRIEI